MKLPIENGKVKVNKGVKYIAAVGDPAFINGECEYPAAVKRVRAQVVTAYQKGVFGNARYSIEQMEDAADFFTWARRKWPKLLSQPLPVKLSVERTVHATHCESPALILTPGTYDELLEVYGECARKLARLEKYVARLEAELAQYKQADSRRRATNRENARKGEGVPKNRF